MPQEYDVLVIGAGTGGYVAAIRAAQLGLRTAVVEKQKALGGTCLLWGCIPTKALLEHAHALKVVQQAREWGVSIASGGSGAAAVSIDMTQVHARKDRIVNGLTKGVEFLFKKNKIDWIKGTARLTGNGGVDVFEGDKQGLKARREIIVATGSTPRSVPGVAIDHERIITSDDAIHLREVPKTVAIMGSGAVGVEFASIFRRFGSDVTILELLPRLVPVEDDAVSIELAKSFRKQGITSHTGAKVTGATATAGAVAIDVQLADGTRQQIRADYLLVATGRAPVTTELNAEGAGLDMEKGYRIRSSRTSRPRKALSPRSALPDRPRARSTTITFRGAPTAIPRSAASASPSRRRARAVTMCVSERFRLRFSDERRSPVKPTGS